MTSHMKDFEEMNREKTDIIHDQKTPQHMKSTR